MKEDISVEEALDEILGKLQEAQKNQPPLTRAQVALRALRIVVAAICTTLWGLGVVMAKGFWWTLIALLIPFIGPGTGVAWLVTTLTGGTW